MFLWVCGINPFWHEVDDTLVRMHFWNLDTPIFIPLSLCTHVLSGPAFLLYCFQREQTFFSFQILMIFLRKSKSFVSLMLWASQYPSVPPQLPFIHQSVRLKPFVFLYWLYDSINVDQFFTQYNKTCPYLYKIFYIKCWRIMFNFTSNPPDISQQWKSKFCIR